ncbi:MAG: CHAP domain-containing protein [Pyrinomonadaceae bacterium]|nr:CHAP domain-containing protein [Pyrinomonadaceae bacterium]
MGFRDVLLFVGYQEIGNSLKSNPARVKEYIDLSCSQPVSAHLQVSWCTHFVHWCVERAGMINKIKRVPLGNQSTGRMLEAFPVTTDPLPGDIYYMPVVGGKATHHFGIVSQVYDNEIESLDGNSGDWRDPRTDWTTKYGGGIGGGMVCLNRRKRSEIKTFLKLTEDAF